MKVIAECGVNWNSLEEAKLMIKRSKEVGCWATKFQLFTKNEAPDLPEHLYLTFEKAKELFDYGKEIGQEVFFTCMYPEAVDWCEEIGVKYYKIRCHDSMNYKLIDKIKQTKKTYFISYDYWMIENKGIQFLCIPQYPADIRSYLSYMKCGFPGISDHTKDTKLLDIAIYLNYEYFEKHVCLTRENCIEAEWAVTFEELEEVLKC